MKNLSVKIFFLIVIIGFNSCYQDLDFERYRSDPTVVLNAVVSPDTVIMANVCLTTFFTDTALLKVVKDAEVKLYVNGVYSEELKWEANNKSKFGGTYISSVTPKESDKIKIEVKSSYGNVWAEDVVPPKIYIEKVEISGRKIEDPKSIIVEPGGNVSKGENFEVRYSITLKDIPNDSNYYCIRIENCNPYQPLGVLDYSDDPVFIEQTSTTNGSFSGEIDGQGGRTFSDKLFDGKDYTLTIKETGNSMFYTYGEILNRKILLYSLSKSYYNYLTSLLNVNENSIEYYLSEYGLYEPVKTFSNIQGGIGIVACSQVDIKLIELRKIFPEYWINE